MICNYGIKMTFQRENDIVVNIRILQRRFYKEKVEK